MLMEHICLYCKRNRGRKILRTFMNSHKFSIYIYFLYHTANEIIRICSVKLKDQIEQIE